MPPLSPKQIRNKALNEQAAAAATTTIAAAAAARAAAAAAAVVAGVDRQGDRQKSAAKRQ